MRRKVSDEGLTLRQMIKLTPGYVRFNSGYVTVTGRVKYDTDKLGRKTYAIKTRTNELGAKPRKHLQTITLLSGRKASNRRAKVRLDCDCEFFTYYCEHALWRYGAAEIKRSNGLFPHVTNPRAVPIVCKHLDTILIQVIKNRV